MTLLGQITVHSTRFEEERDAGKMNVVPLLSQKLLPKENSFRKNGY